MKTGKLKDGLKKWQKVYKSYGTTKFQHFDGINVKVVSQPAILQSINPIIKEFWQLYKKEMPSARNDPKYGVSGLEFFKIVDGVLEIKTFLSDYATTIFRSRGGEEFYKLLTPEQREFVDDHLYSLGVSTYSYDYAQESLLLGKKAGEGITSGLRELVPMGMLDVLKKTETNIFFDNLVKELKEETNLNREEILMAEPRFICHSSKYADISLVYRVIFRMTVEERIKTSEEHEEVRFFKMAELLSMDHHEFNPVTIKILQAIGLFRYF